MPPEKYATLHLMLNLSQHKDEYWQHRQAMTHQFTYIPGNSLPENSLLTLRASAQHSHLLHELDFVILKDGCIIVDHDFLALCTIGVDGLYHYLTYEEVGGKPLLIRKFQYNSFVDGTMCKDKIMNAGNFLVEARKIIPEGTFFPNCHNSYITTIAAWISHLPHKAYLILMYYTFKITSGQQLVCEIEARS